jgi:hypothetical protein
MRIGNSGFPVGTECHYRVKAINEYGTAYGDDMTFISLEPPLR